MIKPVFGIGGPLTDADFNDIRMSKRQAQHAADRLARRYLMGYPLTQKDSYLMQVSITEFLCA